MLPPHIVFSENTNCSVILNSYQVSVHHSQAGSIGYIFFCYRIIDLAQLHLSTTHFTSSVKFALTQTLAWYIAAHPVHPQCFDGGFRVLTNVCVVFLAPSDLLPSRSDLAIAIQTSWLALFIIPHMQAYTSWLAEYNSLFYNCQLSCRLPHYVQQVNDLY